MRCLHRARFVTPSPPPSYQLLELEFSQPTRTDKWLAMNQFNYWQSQHGYDGNQGGNSAWPYSMPANYPSTNSTALFAKYDSGGSIYDGYPAEEGIYTMNTQTPFILRETSPLVNLKSLSFQIYLTSGGEAFTGIARPQHEDMSIYPTLTLQTTGGDYVFESGDYFHSELYKWNEVEYQHSGGGYVFDLILYENYRLFQWDLSFITDTILSFDITFSTFEHVSLRSLQLDQSLSLVPEPATWVLIGTFGIFLLMTRNRLSRLA